MMRPNLFRAGLFAAAGLALPLSALATNGYQLIGVGAYQKSLAGAVTANPGSAMTSVTNPAGMTRVGKRADFSMEMFMPKRSADFTATGGSKEDSIADMYGVPAIGWTAPVADGSNTYFGGGMYGTSGMGVDYAPTKMFAANPSKPSPAMYWDGYSNIAFWQMAPSLAWDMGKGLSFGAALDIDYQSVSFRQRVMADTNGDGVGDTTMSNFDLGRGASGFGYGVTLGVLYDINPAFTVGASYKSRQNFAPLKYQLAYGDITVMNPSTGSSTKLAPGTYKLDLDFPQQVAAGVAYRPSSTVTVSADLKWINWSDTMNKLSVTGPGGSVPMNPGWKDQTVYALGVAYAATSKLNLRAGYNYATAPFGNSEVSHNLILPAIVETHYAAGLDYALNNHWQLGMHYMYVPKKTMTAPMTDSQAPGAKISLSEQSAGMNIGYRF